VIAGYWHFFANCEGAQNSAHVFERRRVMQPKVAAALEGFGDRVLIFAPLKFFLFSRGALFWQFRPTGLLQIVCWVAVGARGWGEID
jgi:hypothetical protein